jgi:hypothetical protein
MISRAATSVSWLCRQAFQRPQSKPSTTQSRVAIPVKCRPPTLPGPLAEAEWIEEMDGNKLSDAGRHAEGCRGYGAGLRNFGVSCGLSMRALWNLPWRRSR